MKYVYQWKQQGRISIWKYDSMQKNYPGWNINCDVLGGDSLLKLLEAFDKDNAECYRMIDVIAPPVKSLTVVNSNKLDKRYWRSPDKLKLKYSAIHSDWRILENNNVVELSFGSSWIPKLEKGIHDLLGGSGDYSIGSGKSSTELLWVWWST